MGPWRAIVLAALLAAADGTPASEAVGHPQRPTAWRPPSKTALPPTEPEAPKPPTEPAARARPADVRRVVRASVSDQLAIEALVDRAIARGDFPGAVVVAGTRQGVFFRRAFGRSSVLPESRPMRADSIFDLASVTKAVATATAIAALVEDGRLGYDDRASRYLPELDTPQMRGITLRALLTHTSGLPPANAVEDERRGLEAAVRAIARSSLARVGEYRYSDLGFILLARIVERVGGDPFDAFVARRIFRPLGLRDTGFSPRPTPRLVPTERDGDTFLAGTVHDPRARALGGVSGHAGLFAPADDLARFARVLLAEGELDGARVLRRESVQTMTRPWTVPGARVTLGWDSPDDPDRAAFSAASFGHEGFTGTSVWMDPVRDRFVVFLSSRLHPDGKGRAAPTAEAIRRVVAHALPETVEEPVESGIDVVQARGFEGLAGRRIALLTHDPARNLEGQRTTDVLFSAPGLNLVRLLAPEHGLGGRGDGGSADGVDGRTGLTVRSLYPTARAAGRVLANVDLLVVDLVDVGVRFYTYEATLAEALRMAAAEHVPVLVLDRPNPLGGTSVDGPQSDPGPRSLVDPFPMPVQHGLTLGELAQLFVAELPLGTSLSVVRARGWERRRAWDPRRQAWFAPSPNLGSPAALRLYPGIALLELTNLSVGRGTPTPFEWIGAPWLDSGALAKQLVLDGVGVSPKRLVPERGPYRGELCHGLAFRVEDPSRVSAVELGLLVAHALFTRHPTEWNPSGVQALLRNERTFRSLIDGAPAARLLSVARSERVGFDQMRAPHLLYE